jgi:TM2 domain-containing membrane protein YozV
VEDRVTKESAAGARPRKNPGLAALLAFLFPGLGQLYNGQFGKAVMFFGLAVVNFMLVFVLIGLFTGLACWIWGVVDAHRSAEKINLTAAVLKPSAT